MQAVCDILEQLLSDGTLRQYAIGGATAAGFHGEPLATRDIDVFVYLDPPPDSLLVTLESLFARLAEMGFTEQESGVIGCQLSVKSDCCGAPRDSISPTTDNGQRIRDNGQRTTDRKPARLEEDQGAGVRKRNPSLAPISSGRGRGESAGSIFD